MKSKPEPEPDVYSAAQVSCLFMTLGNHYRAFSHWDGAISTNNNPLAWITCRSAPLILKGLIQGLPDLAGLVEPHSVGRTTNSKTLVLKIVALERPLCLADLFSIVNMWHPEDQHTTMETSVEEIKPGREFYFSNLDLLFVSWSDAVYLICKYKKMYVILTKPKLLKCI